ncbi:MAG: hypothetical protein WDO15_10645 [Bacteroidota bacterium]
MTNSAPTTTFSNLQASVSGHRDISTKRIEANITGQGDFIHLEKDYDLSKGYLYYDVYTPMATKVRINLPTFPSEILTQVPDLAIVQNNDFDWLDIIKYNSTYGDILKSRLNGTATVADFQQAVSYSFGTSSGRTTIDPKATSKRLMRQGSRYHDFRRNHDRNRVRHYPHPLLLLQ